MGKRVDDKRGISPVVASVLMVLMVVVLAAMIFLWARGFISEQIEKFGRPVEQQCGEIKFQATKEGNALEIVNLGNLDIRHIDIKMTKGGNSEVERFDFNIDSGEGVIEYVTLEMDDGNDPDEIVLYPALIGTVVGKDSNQVFTCMDAGVKL